MAVSHSDPACLRLGFLALTDAAPLIVAHEHGLFEKRGLRVALSREVGWATLRDKLLHGELEAAHALGGMLVGCQLGLGCRPTDVLTAFIFNLHGNALTLSRRLWDAGVREPADLKRVARSRLNKLTFGVVFPWSSHHALLIDWLRSGGLDPEEDARIVVVPPAQMFRNLAAGTIDGYCVGEPWNTLAVHEGAGRVATWSARIEPGHVEKVLLVRAEFASRRAEEHNALIAGLHEAAAWCDEPANRPALVQLLARPAYLNIAPEIIAPALVGPFRPDETHEIDARDFLIYARNDANRPTQARAASLLRRMAAAGLVNIATASDPMLPRRLFREDIYRHAISITTTASASSINYDPQTV